MAAPSQYDRLFLEAGQKYGVDPALLKGIASVESNFNPKAVGPKTRSGQAQGIMQFVPAMQKAYGISDPFNPEQSVDAAARMMRDNLKRYKGDVGMALEAYNGGPRLVGKSTQTRTYAEKVQRKTQLFAKSFGVEKQMAGRSPNPMEKARNVVLGPETLDSMPLDYRAAAALQYFAEEQPEKNPQEEAEKLLAAQEDAEYEQEAQSRFASLLGMFTKQPESTDAFDIFAVAQQPVQSFAAGGRVKTQNIRPQKWQFGGTRLPGVPNVGITPRPKFSKGVQSVVDDRLEKMKQYAQQYPEYEKQYQDYLAQVDAYNTAYQKYKGYADEWNQSTYLPFLEQARDYNDAIISYNKWADYFNEKGRFDNPGMDFNQFISANPQLTEKFGQFRDITNLKPPEQPKPFDLKFEANQPTSPTAPDLGFDYDTFDQWLKKEEQAVGYDREKINKLMETAPQRDLALTVVQDPNQFNLGGFGFAAGGSVDKNLLTRLSSKLQSYGIDPELASMVMSAPLYKFFPNTMAVTDLMEASPLNEGEDELIARYKQLVTENPQDYPVEEPLPVNREKGGPASDEEVLEMFGDTGDRSMAEAKKGFGRSVDAIRRGVQYSPADLLGAPVDLINMALEPVGLGSEKPVGGSEWLIDKGVEAGIYEKPTGEGEETLARFAAGMINPTLGPRAVAKVAEGIETLGKTPPKGAVTLADEAANAELKANVFGRSDTKPFVGELETLLQGLGKEEVTPAEVKQLVTQYKQSLGSKMERRKRRVLEDRIDEIFENKDPNTPIALSQIYSDLERTSPKRFTQEIISPEDIAKTTVSSKLELSENYDNPYLNEKPMGVTSILVDTPKGVEDIGALVYDMESQVNRLNETYQFIGGDQQIQALKQLQRRAQEFEQRLPSSQLSALRVEIDKALDAMPELQKLTKHLTDATGSPRSKELDAVEKGLRKDFPELFDDLRTNLQMFEDPMRRNAYASIGGLDSARHFLSVGRATHARTVKGLLDFEKELIQQGKMTDNLRGQIDKAKLALSKNGSAGIDEFDNGALYYENTPAEEFKKLRTEVLRDVLMFYQADVGNEISRTIRNATDKFKAEASKSIPFGQDRKDALHLMNTKGAKAQQLGFTRFVEFEPTDTILAPYSSSGPPRVPVYDFPESKKGAIFATELQSDMRRAAKKIVRGDGRPFETPFNLMNQEALRDLLIKNMVDVAVKRNRDLVLFPGADSKRPELYEDLHKYVEATTKSLGPNFKAVEVMTVNGEGKRVVRSGIFITPEGEKEILEKGLKFAKGGMVDKPLYDRAA